MKLIGFSIASFLAGVALTYFQLSSAFVMLNQMSIESRIDANVT